MDTYKLCIAINFMLINTIFVSHSYGYLSTPNGFHCVMVITINLKLVDTMFESHLCG